MGAPPIWYLSTWFALREVADGSDGGRSKWCPAAETGDTQAGARRGRSPASPSRPGGTYESSPILPFRPGFEPEDARQSRRPPSRRGVLRSRGFGRTPRERGRPRQRGSSAEGERVRRSDQGAARQRRLHEMVREG